MPWCNGPCATCLPSPPSFTESRVTDGRNDTPGSRADARFRHLSAISEVSAAAWDALFPGPSPFVRHGYLRALEDSGSVCPATGWTPRHLVLESADGALLAACPLYLKDHSYGEFVFDFSWAEAAMRAGLRYYPKWVAAVPFTPSVGPRWGAVDAAAATTLLAQLRRLPEAEACGSLHLLFAEAEAAAAGEAVGALVRQDLQYHWFNPGYADFDDFLSRLRAEARKKLRRERERVQAHGLHFERCPAADLGAQDWASVYALYANTYAERGQHPYLTPAFFEQYRRQPDNALWVLSGYRGRERLVMALFLKRDGHLYGRHWGSRVALDGAHFETCYYQGIEWCINDSLVHFDAGTQGAHKRHRGFEPLVTHSLHWLHHPGLRDAVARALNRERAAIAAEVERLRHHTVYRPAADIPGH